MLNYKSALVWDRWFGPIPNLVLHRKLMRNSMDRIISPAFASNRRNTGPRRRLQATEIFPVLGNRYVALCVQEVFGTN